jgi:hypothetical protein
MKEKEIPTHPGFPIFVRHIEDVMKNILDLPPSTLLPLALIILYCVCVCVCVCVGGKKKCGWKCLRLPLLYAIRSFADRLPIVRRGGAALNRTRHEDGTDDTLRGQVLPSAREKKRRGSTQRKEVG